jgi:hypothetical protein
MGYIEQEVKVTSEKLTIIMKEDSQQLEEVVVIGYGTMQKRDITGAITSVDSKIIEERNAGHQRWSTGMLFDNCILPDGGIDFKNRGSMGSGHGWGTAWSVAWNCEARNYVNQLPPGTYNWMIGCIGERLVLPRPFDKEGALPEAIFDAHGHHVVPKSLYLAQLEERMSGNITEEKSHFP